MNINANQPQFIYKKMAMLVRIQAEMNEVLWSSPLAEENYIQEEIERMRREGKSEKEIEDRKDELYDIFGDKIRKYNEDEER